MAKRHSYVSDGIAGAMLQLLAEKPFMDITVTDVVKKAEVSRASFYRNYKTTTDVLDHIISETVNGLAALVLPAMKDPSEENLRSFLYDYIDFVNNDNQKYIFKSMENLTILLSRLVKESKKVFMERESDSMTAIYNPEAKFFMINAVILKWNEMGRRESVDDIVSYLLKAILSF